jgi:hypothetical protein
MAKSCVCTSAYFISRTSEQSYIKFGLEGGSELKFVNTVTFSSYRFNITSPILHEIETECYKIVLKTGHRMKNEYIKHLDHA